jgi:hypothetical protein
MMKFGFFESMPLQDAKAIIEGLRSATPPPHEEQLINYLLKAPVWMVSAGVAKDILTGGTAIGPLNVRTDGVWAWTDDVAYYVRKYHLSLPEEFLRHIENSQYTPPLAVDLGKLPIADVLGSRHG